MGVFRWWIPLAIVLFFSQPLQAGAEPKHKVLQRCGATVTVPTGWQAGPAESDPYAGCGFGLRPPAWRLVRQGSSFAVGPYAIRVTVVKGSVSEAVRKGNLFRRSDGGLCHAHSRSCAEDPEIRTKCCSVFIASRTSRRMNKNGEMAGTDSFSVAVVIGTDHFADILADYEFLDDMVFEQIVKSVQFR
jgi:hypothetical protein